MKTSGPGSKEVFQCDADSLSQPLQPNMTRNENSTQTKMRDQTNVGKKMLAVAVSFTSLTGIQETFPWQLEREPLRRSH